MMNTENSTAQYCDGAAKSLSPACSNDEIKKLEKRLANLRDLGILFGGDGPREPLRPVARVPGGLERFLAERK